MDACNLCSGKPRSAATAQTLPAAHIRQVHDQLGREADIGIHPFGHGALPIVRYDSHNEAQALPTTQRT
jgi:hypothetical protein